MPSWRDEVSEQAQAECDRMFDVALPFAQDMLADYGEFYPYAMKMLDDGSTQGVAIRPGKVARPRSKTIVDTLYQRLGAERETLRAVAVVADVLLTSNTSPMDAIRIDVEHRDGVAIAVLVPYVKKGEHERPDFGEPRATYGERRLWPPTA